jgi:carbon storage regulator
MLVLTRRIGEQIVVPGCGLTITVVAVRRNRVHLGSVAPPEVTMHRREVWQRIFPTQSEPCSEESFPCGFES